MGCSKPAPPSANGAAPESASPARALPTSAQQATQAQQAQQAQQAPATDGEFEIIWTRPPQPATGLSHPTAEELYLTRVGLNAASVAFDLKSENHDPESPNLGRTQVPEIDLYVDGCPVPAPRLPNVRLSFDGAAARLTLPRESLPPGELTIKFKAFDNEFSMLFANDTRGFRTITMEEMKGYHVRPGKNGEPDTVSVPMANCPATGR